MAYLMYLRKSRADKEAEARGEGETLSRHEQILSQYAAKMQLDIGAIYKEIVSGETISARPQMQKLLIEVMQGMWDGVLVMEIERLARGDTKDQGTVAEAFKFSNTKIITPAKTYDPSNEFDEEYFEFNLFMSRREYKTINRRIQRGRTAAFEDGWYIASTAPYGYEKVKHKGSKGYTLEIVESEAKVVRMIYDLYTHGELQGDGSYLHYGSYQIRDRLNKLGIPSRSGGKWSSATVMDILRNPTYCGYQRWQWRKNQKKIIDNKVVEIRPKDKDCPKVKGRFEPIITESQYEEAQISKSVKYFPQGMNNTLQNPLSGLVCCAKCHTKLARQLSNTKGHYAILRCPNSQCNNVSSPLVQVEEKLIEGLADWIEEYKIEWPENKLNKPDTTLSILDNSLMELEGKLSQVNKQLSSIYNLLEQGVYALDVFQERHSLLKGQKTEYISQIETVKKERELALSRDRARKEFIPKLQHIVDTYWKIDDVYARNIMLKEVVDHVDYLKNDRNKKWQGNTANFSLHFYPKLPEL